MKFERYEIWREGFAISGGEAEPAALLAVVDEAFCFHDAVGQWVRSPQGQHMARYVDFSNMTVWGCKLFDNETEAREGFG